MLARCAAVRGVTRRLHDRPARGGGRAPARHPPPRQRAPPARGAVRRAARDRGQPGREPGGARRPGRARGRRGRGAARSEEDEVYAALRTGLRDYVEKNGFERVVLALSGGIDSALVALIAVDALAPERVTCVLDAVALLERGHPRGCARRSPRTWARSSSSCRSRRRWPAYDELLAGPFAGTEPDVAEENLQARIRGNVVMALSNKFGWLVLTTGNKSELSVGYATLYGDMAGGFAVLKDVYKGLVYRLVRWRNEAGGPRARARLGARAPAVGRAPPRAARRRVAPALRRARRDPRGLHRGGPGRGRAGGQRACRPRTWSASSRMVDRAEYKRRQAPPGIKISTQRLRPRPAAADHERLPRALRSPCPSAISGR